MATELKLVRRVVLAFAALFATSAAFAADQSAPLPNGIELHTGALVMRVVALRDDVVRVRIGRAGQLPEDASWAVLPGARGAQTAVNATPDGFSTSKLSVSINRATLALTVRDAAGEIISADTPDAPLTQASSPRRAFRQFSSHRR